MPPSYARNVAPSPRSRFSTLTIPRRYRPEATPVGAQNGPMTDILTPAAHEFVADLHRRFAQRRTDLLARRARRREEAARAGRLDFLPETRDIRAADWTVAPAAPDLVD